MPDIVDFDGGQVEVSADGSTVWVLALDGSTVGRFSKRFGLDVHTTVTEQLNGLSQCLNCTHEPAGLNEWHMFRESMKQYYEIEVPHDLIKFD